MPEGMGAAISFESFPFETDAGIGARARIGVVVLASDHTLEYEFRSLLNLPGVSFYESRIPNSPIITPMSLQAMHQDISGCAAVILPGAELDVIAYGCTSASIVMGEDAVFDCLRKGRPEAKPTTPVTAAFAAFEALSAKRIAVLTPYTPDVNAVVHRYFTEHGYKVPAFGSFNEKDDNICSRITLDSLRSAIAKLGNRPDVDMVFLSCTSLRLVEVISEIEAEIGKPVTSSNHAMAWHCLRLAGIPDQMPQFGQLFTV